MQLLRYFNNWPKPALIFISVLLLIITGVLDYVIPWELYVFILYLLPVIFAAWFTGKWAGYGFAILGAIQWAALDILSNHTYEHPLIPVWNSVIMVCILLFISFVLTQLKELIDDLDSRVKIGVESIHEKENLLRFQSRKAAMGEMIGNVAHQWRQPLNALGLVIQNYKMAFQSGKLNAAFIDQSRETGMQLIMHMSQTIDDFLNFYKTDKEKTTFSITGSFQRIYTLLEHSLKINNIQIKTSEAENIEILGYPNEFGQVLMNLIQNSRDAFLERNIKDPMISVRIFKSAGNAVITVEDNAGGISQSIMDKIFDPYFTTKNSGTGIGLYMCKLIVEKNLGGQLTAENTDGGVVFTIQIKLSK